MAGRAKREEAEPGLFDVRLEGIERTFDPDFETEVYSVEFHCDGPMGTVFATVTIDADNIPTLEIIPRAMSDLHRLFKAMTEQSRSWLMEGT